MRYSSLPFYITSISCFIPLTESVIGVRLNNELLSLLLILLLFTLFNNAKLGKNQLAYIFTIILIAIIGVINGMGLAYSGFALSIIYSFILFLKMILLYML